MRPVVCLILLVILLPSSVASGPVSPVRPVAACSCVARGSVTASSAWPCSRTGFQWAPLVHRQHLRRRRRDRVHGRAGLWNRLRLELMAKERSQQPAGHPAGGPITAGRHPAGRHGRRRGPGSLPHRGATPLQLGSGSRSTALAVQAVSSVRPPCRPPWRRRRRQPSIHWPSGGWRHRRRPRLRRRHPQPGVRGGPGGPRRVEPAPSGRTCSSICAWRTVRIRGGTRRLLTCAEDTCG